MQVFRRGCSFGCLLFFAWTMLGLVGTSYGELSLQRTPLNPAFERWVKKRVSQRDRSVLEVEEGSGYVPPPTRPVEVATATLHLYQVPSVPESYDLRDPNGDGDTSDSRLTPVKNQGSCGACWTFGSYGSLESTLKTTRGTTYDFSEDNLKHRHGFDVPPCGGGNWLMAMAYMTRNDGPIDEADDPWDPSPSSTYCTDCTPKLYVGNMEMLPESSSEYEVKLAIYQHGALVTSMYWEDASYDAATKTYRYTGSADCDHAVVVVGWDDNKVVPGATAKGAWIVRNSWGSAWGDSGYFYISYEDTGLGKDGYAFFDDPSSLQGKKAAKVYYYDKLGRTGGVGAGSYTLWGANKFKATQDGTIDAVVFYASAPNTSYEIKILKDGFSGEVAASQSGSVEREGWYTVVLDSPVSVESDDTFIVAVKFTTPGYKYPVPIEDKVANYSTGASASSGQSYISQDGSHWTDLTTQFADANVCIKAVSFTTGSEPSPTPEPEPEPEPQPEPAPSGHKLVPGEVTEVSRAAATPVPDAKIYLGFGNVVRGGPLFTVKAAFPAYLNESGDETIKVKIFVAGQIPYDYSYLFFFTPSGLSAAPPDTLSPWKEGVEGEVPLTTLLEPIAVASIHELLQGTNYWYTLVVPDSVNDDLSNVDWENTPWELTIASFTVK